MKTSRYILLLISVSFLHALDAKPGFHAAMQLGTPHEDKHACQLCHVNNASFDSQSEGVGLSSKDTEGVEISRACAGCHDGIEAQRMEIPATSCTTSDITACTMASHPVFVPYGGGAGLKALHAPLDGEWYRASAVNDLLRSGQVVCISCHDPHNAKTRFFIRNRGALCRGCHNK